MGQEEQLINEINILHKLQHENILKFEGCLEDSKNVYLVTELATDGALIKKMNPKGLDESIVTRVSYDD